VRLPSAKELVDVSLVRAEIDALAARLAVECIADATLEALDGLIEEMLTRLEAGDFSGVTEADVRFHHLIAEASENHALERAFEQLAPFARTFITLTLPGVTLTLPGVDVRGIVQEHRPILEALRARDADRAADAARVHQLSVSRLLQTHFPAALGDPATGQGDDAA
jgi:DNA-binding GntR family transcriptional regulator